MVYHGRALPAEVAGRPFRGGGAPSKMRAMRHGLRLALVLVLAGVAQAQEGQLDEVREEVRDEEQDDDPYDDDDDEDDDDWLDFLAGEATSDGLDALLLFPFSLPRALLGDVTFEPATFQAYPGRAGSGFWWTGERAGEGRSLALRPRVELGSDFDELERTAFGLDLEHESRFGLELEWGRWREDLGAGGSDELDLGELDLVYRFAQASSAAFYSGLGLNVLDDATDTEYGLNFTYGASFLAAPFTFGFDSDLGTLGDATLTHLGFAVGLVLERFELFAGHDSWDIGSAELDCWSLGLRGWF